MDQKTKTLATVCFYLVIGALVAALLSDIIIVGGQILTFISALFGAAIVFIIGFCLFIVSCVLIFGIYLFGEYGFWPLSWAAQTFDNIMSENPITVQQINILIGIRAALLAICLFGIIASAIVKSRLKWERKINKGVNQRPARAYSGVSLGLSIMGLIVSIGAMALFLLLLYARSVD